MILLSAAIVPFVLDDAFAATVGAHVTKINTDFTEAGEAAVAYEVCSGNNHLTFPQILVYSDMESKLITMDRDIEPNVCQGGATILEAENFSSITALLVTDIPDISIDEKTRQLESARVAYHGMSNDGQILVEVSSTVPQENMPLDIVMRFTDELGNPVPHVNFDLKISQQGDIILEQSKLHTHTGKSLFMTSALNDDSSVDIDVVLQGIGLPNEETKWTGPVGELITFKVVPEFGGVIMVILVVAITVTIIASAKFSNLRVVSVN
ncbi:PEFG-CTERM sorting domain-containing protein [Candidatus Nitrosopumilus koreensis]|nr:PEFG-CTERM sorting domain-containing protein [Candidatus Nitrosopumilus koreensis]